MPNRHLEQNREVVSLLLTRYQTELLVRALQNDLKSVDEKTQKVLGQLEGYLIHKLTVTSRQGNSK